MGVTVYKLSSFHFRNFKKKARLQGGKHNCITEEDEEDLF